MKTAFIVPFSLDRLTGTPIRAKTTIRARADLSEVCVIATALQSVNLPKESLFSVGRCNLVKFTARTLKILRQEKPTHLHGFTTVSIVPMLVYKLLFSLRVRIVFEMHGWTWLGESRNGRPFTRVAFLVLDYIGLWFASAVIAVSDAYSDFLKKRTWKASRVFSVWDAAEFEVEYQAPPRRDVFVVGYIGGNAWWQGLQSLIGAARILVTRRDISFVIAGFNPTDREQFPALPNITYPGYVQRDAVVGFIRGCDITISTRIEDVTGDLLFPHKVSEYMACGRAVITSGAGDQPAIIRDARCGTVVTPMTAEALAHAIEQVTLMTSHEREEWGRRALEYAQDKLLYGSFRQKLSNIYKKLGVEA